MKIGIVGTGISGLVAAYLLGRGHEVTVFEAADYIGGHSNTVDVKLDGQSHAVDTGFIVYNEKTYPGFCELLDQLGVSTQASDMSFSVSSDLDGTEYATHSLDALFARRRNLLNPRFHFMIREILRFNRDARELLDPPGPEDEQLTLGGYLASRGYSQRFVDHYVIPMGAAIWSAAPDRFLEFPASTFVRFFENHGLLDHRDRIAWRTVAGGSRQYVAALVAAMRARIHTRCPVLAAQRHADRVDVLLPDGVRMSYDHVIIASHSDQALRILQDASEAERGVLGAIAYQTNEVVLHTDATQMPVRRRAWASWNYRIRRDAAERASVTYWMNRLQNLESTRPILVSLNAEDSIAPDRVLRRFTYHHPVYDAATLGAQRRRDHIDGLERTHFCGAYWGHGFHEDGVQSALAVCRRFGVEL